ncbi:hypothetical protein GGR57DRAFT_464105 [Xylariaceae sp. FL1272]|nr:hypothetical protein GGR57DRAFT_464105 [Xylariaceae sp. FL1272]
MRAVITWDDGQGDPDRPCLLVPARGNDFDVVGGRLGRDHTFEDVPKHRARDSLMDYINARMDNEDEKRAAHRAICPDLSEQDISNYASLIAKIRGELSDGETETEKGLQPVKKKHPQQELERFKQVIEDGSVKSIAEAQNIMRQEDLLEAIDDSISLSPIPYHRDLIDEEILLDFQLLANSAFPCDETIYADLRKAAREGVEYDCDQVRAMIKIFVQTNNWSLDQFRRTIHVEARKPFIEFLEKKGPTYGINSLSFKWSWAFFKVRQLRNLPLRGAPADRVLQQRGANRGQKRRSLGTADDKENQADTSEDVAITHVAKAPRLQAV